MKLIVHEHVPGIIEQAWREWEQTGSAMVKIAGAIEANDGTAVVVYNNDHKPALDATCSSMGIEKPTRRGGSSLMIEGHERPKLRFTGVAIALGHTPLPDELMPVAMEDFRQRCPYPGLEIITA